MDVAILNLLGMLYYSVRQVGKALEFFERALEINPDSLNSLENISYIYELLGRNKDATDARQRVHTILPDPLAQARCLAEQGYAVTFGSVEGDSIEHLKQSAKYFQRAIALAKTNAQRNERANWYLCISVIMQKINDKKFSQRNLRGPEFMECLEACLIAHQLTRDGDKTLHAMSLRTLATLKSKGKGLNYKEIDNLLRKHDARHYYHNPEESFKKALELDPNNPESYTRYAKVMIRKYCYDKDEEVKQKGYETAMNLLDTYIDTHESLDEEITLSVTDR